MIIALYFVIIAVVSYLIGTINIARIIAQIKHKEITKMGSGNPGTMNILRNFGFGIAFLCLLTEVVKAGLTCLVAKLCMQGLGYGELAFYLAGFFVVIGGDFPCFYKFKGGKGVACTGGMFMFSQLWWLGLIIFTVCVIMIIITEYGFLSSLFFIIAMSIAVTVHAFLTGIPYAWAITTIVWLLTIICLIKHRGNIVRFVHGNENKANFKKSFMKLFKKKEKTEETPKVEENSDSQNVENNKNIENQE